jgi:hypothetical protein
VLHQSFADASFADADAVDHEQANHKSKSEALHTTPEFVKATRFFMGSDPPLISPAEAQI